ncbi:hypothetical protein K6U06_06505 [Acidiferrimicrobium sp. IK]|uniref:hypothetical protein n=1 Tax=Acidiferrimicrobium sp. IK TaxID=2871700 RepID=UPI0021CB310C|nr:hypothetical protein [Acidiferrimicrobium sp. IK]MCU4184004.1 hypothetical protein [Acidiferrimicrobium sp. IK]
MTDVDDDRNWRLKSSTGPLPAPLERIKEGWYGSRVLGGLAEVTVGCMVWAHADGDLAKIRLDPNGEPRGGIVLAIYPAIDYAWLRETGEPVERKHYRCFNPRTGWPKVPADRAFVTLTEVQIVAEGCEATYPPAIADTIRRFDQHLAAQHGPLTADQAQLQIDAAHLAAVLMGDRT